MSKTLESYFKVPALSILDRVKDTSPLFEMSKFERKLELENAFRTNLLFIIVRLFKIKRVILIDDLITTGYTYLTCSKILRSLGVEKVDLLTLFSKK